VNPAFLFQFLPYAARITKAAETIERLEKDPDVQDVIKLVEELGKLVVSVQHQDAKGT
jgi:hypothetical protein